MQVLITGASRGIGRAIALRLQSEYSLVLHASSRESLTPLFNELDEPEKHDFLCADFCDPAATKGFCTELRKRYAGSLIAVVNNAGITIDKSLLFQPETDVDKILQVNLKTPILICKAAFKIYHANGRGTIINIGSCVGETGNAFQAVYAASKAGLVAFSKSLAREAGALIPAHNIRVLSVAPGYIETEMTDKIPNHEKLKYLGNIPSRRLGSATEVAALIGFLLSDEGGYINGSEIKINGGIV